MEHWSVKCDTMRYSQVVGLISMRMIVHQLHKDVNVVRLASSIMNAIHVKDIVDRVARQKSGKGRKGMKGGVKGVTVVTAVIAEKHPAIE